jgi:primosomal replication protein N
MTALRACPNCHRLMERKAWESEAQYARRVFCSRDCSKAGSRWVKPMVRYGREGKP